MSKQNITLFFIIISFFITTDSFAMKHVDHGQYISPVKRHGQLSVDGRDLIDSAGKAVQLRGVSSFWLNWKGEFSNPSSIKTLKEDWGISVFRAAMARQLLKSHNLFVFHNFL